MDDPDFALIARALADPRRAALLGAIARQGEMRCAALVACAGVSAPTLSHHVHELERAGLLTLARHGKELGLTFRPETLRAYLDHLARAYLLPS